MAIDQPYLATFFALEESTLRTLVNDPTPDAVTKLLQAATRKATEFDSLRADKLHSDVELESILRSSEAKVKTQKSVANRQSKEIDELKTQLESANTARRDLENANSTLKSNTTSNATETQSLQARVQSLESSKRDTLAALDKIVTEKDGMHKELHEQISKSGGLRKNINELEEQNRLLQNELTQLKFKQQQAKQEAELYKSSYDRQAADHKAYSADVTRRRTEQRTAFANVQHELEEKSASLESVKSSEQNLRQQLKDMQTKVEAAYEKNATIQETAAHSEQSLKAQLITAKRLADLHAQAATTHKARLEEQGIHLEQVRDDAAEEIGRLQTELETERADKLQAEQAIVQLELRLEQEERTKEISVPSTPAGNGTSPAIRNSTHKSARNLSHTQLYSQYVEMKQALEHEERRSARLQEALDEMIVAMENRAPEIIEFQEEQHRLETEVIEFGNMVDKANGYRDAAMHDARRWEGEARDSAKEAEILRQQLRDSAAQIKILLVELQSKEQGLEAMTVQERLEIERAARGEINGRTIDYDNSTQRLISEQLVIFRNVSELQQRNEQLLRLTRELGDKMEGEEAMLTQRQYAADHAENVELREQIHRYRDELQITATQIDSYMKERDMFRRMLQYRGTIPAGANMQEMFGNSVAPATPQQHAIEPATPRSKDVEDLNKVLKEQQKFFDQYREETLNDRRVLKEQVDTLSREKTALQLDLARAEAQFTLATERFELWQSNASGLQNENVELRKRGEELSRNAAKQDIRVAQVAEELVGAKSQLDTLRSELANGKAEKDLWRRIEARLSEENKQLMDDRSRLSKLNTDLSNLANERERSDNEARKRLQGQVDALEKDLNQTQHKLDNEIESNKKTTLRREYEDSQNRTRIDDLTKSLSNTREELAAARTIKEQLQSRVEEIKIELRAAEEKAYTLQARPSARGDFSTSNAESVEGLTAEQQLAMRLSDVKRDLDLAHTELDSAREQIEQYKKIAQSTEEELANLNQVTEQYREESDAVLAEKDVTIRGLEQRIEDLTAELTATNTELSDLRTQHDNASQEIASQRAMLEAELARLKDNAERHAEEKRLYQEDLKAQAEIAQQAQQSYESELVKHADAARNLHSVREELYTLRIEVATIRAQAEAAKATLDNSEESWLEQKEGLQREIAELNQRRSDIDSQNKLLHQQLETFSTELQALRQGRTFVASTGVADEDEATVSSAATLQEVITYLRREKEILEVQHEMATQESSRLQQQLDYANSQVDDLHQKLADERRQHSDRTLTEASTSRLAQTINELNLYRESAVTLRNEARQAQERLEQRDKEVNRLLAELQPLQAKVGELEADVEVKDSEITLITNDRDHWRDRTQNIISKYDRVDPAEMEELRARIEALQAEKEQAQADLIDVQSELESTKQRVTELEASITERLDKFKQQAKAKDKERVQAHQTVKAELDAAVLTQTQMSAELERAKADLAAAKESSTESAGLSTDEIEKLRSRIAEADAQASTRTIEVESLQSRVEELEEQIVKLEEQLTVAQSSTQDNTEQGEIVDANVASEALAQAQQQLADAKEEIARLQAEQTQTSAITATDTSQTSAGDVAAEVLKLRTEMEQQHEVALKQVQEAADAKITKMRENLKRQLNDSRDKIKEEVRAELIEKHSTELQAVREEYEKTIETLKQEHGAEMARLHEEGMAAVKHSSISTASSSGGDGASDRPEITDDYVNELMKSNQRVRNVMQNSVRKFVAKETEKYSQALAAKDFEIAKLKESSSNPATQAPVAADSELQQELKSLREALENASSEKDNAVSQALDSAEKKSKVQLSQRDIALAKVAVVSKAAQDTPDKAVSEVWEEAKKARPALKAAAQPTQTADAAPAPAVPAKRFADAAEDDTSTRAAKMQNRAERFAAPAPAQRDNAVQSSVAAADARGSNPQASAFVPGTAARGGTGIPTYSGRGGRGGAVNDGAGMSIQGAAARNAQASGIARGGGNNSRGRDGHAGNKRQYEGGQGGHGKRPRGV